MKKLTSLPMAALVLALAGCGGGGGDVVTPPAAAQILGIGATGAALSNAIVAITNGSGVSPCTENSITTDESGAYKCTLKSGEVAPFYVVITDPYGNTTPLVSVATSTPQAGGSVTLNATPLTTAIVGQLNDGDSLGVVSDKRKFVAEKFSSIKANVINQIQDLVSSVGATTSYDPFATTITAATSSNGGNAADKVLDAIKIVRTSNMRVAISTIADPAPVELATTAPSSTTVAGIPSNASDLSSGMFVIAKDFEKCFKLDVASRVTLNGNGDITDSAPECKNIFTTLNNPLGAPAFKHRGYSANDSILRGLLTNAAMTGAKFSPPEVMAYYPSSEINSTNSADINIRYIDKNNVPGNRITTVQNLPNTSTSSHPTNWWITGDQSNYDISVRPQIRKVIDWLDNSGGGTYQVGLDFNVSASPSAPLSSTLDSVNVTGRGLPPNGIWLVRSTTGYPYWFVVTINRLAPPQVLANLTQVCNACVTFWMSRTQGLTGPAASALKTNPNNMQWAQPGEGAYNGTSDTNRPRKGDVYKFRIYKNGSLVATEYRTLLSELVSATNMQYLPWHQNGPNTMAAFDKMNTNLTGLKDSLLIDWIANPYAELIDSIWVSQTDGNYSNATAFKLGSTKVVATPDGAGAKFTSITGSLEYINAPLDGFREIGFSYRTTDGTKKNMTNYFYP